MHFAHKSVIMNIWFISIWIDAESYKWQLVRLFFCLFFMVTPPHPHMMRANVALLTRRFVNGTYFLAVFGLA